MAGYLEDFQIQINNRDFSKFLQLWEEYSKSDSVETTEFVELLKLIKSSDFAKLFGQLVETALPLWKTIQNPEESYLVLANLMDLQTTNTPALSDLALEAVNKRYSHQKEFNERLRLIGLRPKENFQGALSNYDLLDHVKKGKSVFHAGGWGTGEIMENSTVREQLAIEFENVPGLKHITYTNAFKVLVPLADSHFLSRRFGNADALEKQAKEDPLSVIKLLLADLGPKTALEIKDELCERVIPEAEWTKWWQGVRAKLKKDTMIDSPENTKGVFTLRKTASTHADRFSNAIDKSVDIDEIIQASYNFLRDFSTTLKQDDVKKPLLDKLLETRKNKDLQPAQNLQILSLLDSYFPTTIDKDALKDSLVQQEEIKAVVDAVEIIAIKKKLLIMIREVRSDWKDLFIHFLFSSSQGTLRDYIIKELNHKETRNFLVEELTKLLQQPETHPELLVWYFNKIVPQDEKDLPFGDKNGLHLFLESFLILYSIIENKPEYRDLLKKMYTTISGKRFAVIRQLFEGTTIEYIKECLLLSSKCQTLSDHDQKILRSLAEVVHPTLAVIKSNKHSRENDIIWTTEAGYLNTQERAKRVGTIEIVENAKEIEAARALGDLRENSEYKFALEKRSRLQGELKTLSDQLSHARLITPLDISTEEVGIGNVVELLDKDNKKIVYTILGPWEANVDEGILSSQSKFVQAMYGLKVNDTFQFRDDTFKIISLRSYLDKG